MGSDPMEARTIALGHDRDLVVRTATDVDVDGLVALYEALDAEDRYRRFFSAYRPERAFFQAMVDDLDRGGDEIVAIVSEGARGELVGEAGYRLLPDGDGELSTVVTPRWRGWLGPYLLAVLCERAAGRGVRNLRADVLVTNRPMLSLLFRRPWARDASGDLAIVGARIGTRGGPPTWPDRRRRRHRVLVEGAGAGWVDSDAFREHGIEAISCSGPGGDAIRCPALRGEPCPLVTGADLVVIPHLDGVTRWDAILAAHASVHPDARILVELGRPDDVTERIAADATFEAVHDV